jgi:hypothetical protein
MVTIHRGRKHGIGAADSKRSRSSEENYDAASGKAREGPLQRCFLLFSVCTKLSYGFKFIDVWPGDGLKTNSISVMFCKFGRANRIPSAQRAHFIAMMRRRYHGFAVVAVLSAPVNVYKASALEATREDTKRCPSVAEQSA